MTCDDRPLSCQLERIADALSQTPVSWTDIVTGIVVPVLLGVATLIVAIASIRTAREATRLNRELHAENLDLASREKRLAVAALVGEWIGYAIFSPRQKSFAAKADAARLAIDMSPEPSAKRLMGWLLRRIHHEGAETALPPAETYNVVRKVIDEWAELPSTLDRTLEVEARVVSLTRAAAEQQTDA